MPGVHLLVARWWDGEKGVNGIEAVRAMRSSPGVGRGLGRAAVCKVGQKDFDTLTTGSVFQCLSVEYSTSDVSTNNTLAKCFHTYHSDSTQHTEILLPHFTDVTTEAPAYKMTLPGWSQ